MIEIIKNTSNDYSFTLKSESGQALLNSVAFLDKETAKEAIRSLKTVLKSRNAFERKTNHNGKFLFSLKNNNGEVVGHSLIYQSEAGMQNGIKNIINRIHFLSHSNQL